MTDEEYKEYEDLYNYLYETNAEGIRTYKGPPLKSKDPKLLRYLELEGNALRYRWEHNMLTVRDLIENG